MSKFLNWLRPYRCGDGIDFFDRPPCDKKFFSLASAMVHYILEHREPRTVTFGAK